MADIPPIPQQAKVRSFIAENSPLHPGLLFDRFFPCWKSDAKGNGITLDKPFAPALNRFCSTFNSLRTSKDFQDLLARIHERQKSIVRQQKGIELEFKTTGPLATGLGNNHPTENGFLFDRACGVPYLPGRAIKGLCRAWATTCGRESQVATLLGSSIQPFTTGELVFLDAYPKNWPHLNVDVICNHHFEYYSTLHGDRKFDGKLYPAPLDVESPVPVFHLVLSPDTAFVIRILPLVLLNTLQDDLENNLARIKSLLTEALEYLGIGAKTAVGYGTMVPMKSPRSADKQKQWEIDPMQGTIRTFISYSHQNKDAVHEFLGKSAYLGVSPWLDKQDLLTSAGHSLEHEIAQGLHGDDIAAITLFYSKDSMGSDWVRREVELANKLGKHIIPILPDDDEELRGNLQQWLKPDNPQYLKLTEPSAPFAWAASIIRNACLDQASEVVLYLGHRLTDSRPKEIPEQWSEKPTLDLRTPYHRREDFYSRDMRYWTPETSEEYQAVENAIAFLRRSLPAVQRLYVTGLAPLGIGGLIGKHWDRGSGPVRIITWNSYAEEEWTIERINLADDWTPEQAKHLSVIDQSQRKIGDGSALLLGHFAKPHQFEAAAAWAEEHQSRFQFGSALCLQFPININKENAAAVAEECAKSFAWARRTLMPFPKTIYWAAGLPLALMPLITHLTRATGKIIFLENYKEEYIQAFELV